MGNFLHQKQPTHIHSFGACPFFPATSLCVILRYPLIWLKRLCSSGFRCNDAKLHMTVAIGETFSQAVLVISRTAKPSRNLFWSFREWRNLLASCFSHLANGETFSQAVLDVSPMATTFCSSRKLTFRHHKAKIIKNND